MDKRKAAATTANSPSKRNKSADENGAADKYAYLKEKQDPRPDVYNQKPPQPKEKKPGQLTPEQVDAFFEKGYVLVEDYFDKALLDRAKDAINELVDRLANILYKAGKIKNLHKDKGYFERLTYIDREYPGASVVMHKLGALPQAFKDIWSNENLLNAIEQLIGPEIAGHPVWNLRTKTPRNEQATVPWHQDNSYLEPCALNVLQPTAWIPLLDATKITGCMEMASGGHKKGITAPHVCCAGDTWYTELTEEEMTKTLGVDLEKDLEICEVPYGGVLFLNNAVPHRSLENYSDKIRWSLDLRWQRPDYPNGFHGLGKSVLMRTSKDPNYKIDWSDMEHSRKRGKEIEDVAPDDERLAPVIVGPWMHRWDVVHHNKHSRALATSGGDTNWHKN